MSGYNRLFVKLRENRYILVSITVRANRTFTNPIPEMCSFIPKILKTYKLFTLFIIAFSILIKSKKT